MDPSPHRQGSAVLDERYGRADRRRRTPLLVAAGALVAVALGWVAWVAWFHATPDVQSSLTTFDVRDDHTVVARVQLDVRTADAGGSCLLRAFAADHSVVGELNLPVPAAVGLTSSDEAVRTERRATTVEMVGCTTPRQNRPR